MRPSRSKLNYKYRECVPPVFLTKQINKIWIFESSNRATNEPQFYLIPDYTSSLLFIYSIEADDVKIILTGPNTQNFPVNNNSGQITIGYRFNPLTFPAIFNITPGKLLNQSVRLEECINNTVYNDLKNQFNSSSSISSKTARINKFISKSFREVIFPNEEISDAMVKIISLGGKIKMESIYSDIHISQRQFQRIFTKFTGLTPKVYCKIVRFHNVTRKLVSNNFMHYDTLVESGYYDQSHYYREFKEFLGILPKGFEFRQKKILHGKLLE